jgi:hypothetical protein
MEPLGTSGRRRRSHLLLLVPAVALPLAALGCGGSRSAQPTRLMNGARASSPPERLDGVTDPVVLTRVRVVRAARISSGSAAMSCMRRTGVEIDRSAPVVERVGVTGESVTFREASGRSLDGCDNSLGPREDRRRWCGEAGAELVRGRLRDPRLDVICQTEDGTPLGFVWIQPSARTRYVAVAQRGFTEAYEVAGGLPVRVTTVTDVDLARFRATLRITEHDRRGRLVRRYRLDAAVAG